MTPRFSCVCLCLMSIIVTGANAVDLKSVKEGDCVGAPVFRDLDMDWVFSLKKWYYPLWCKYELYRMAEDFLGKDPSLISQKQLDKSCIVGVVGDNKGDVHGEGFGGKTVGYEYTIDENKMITTTVIPTGNKWRGSTMKSVTTLTDNKTFTVTVQCWENGERSWAVGSPTKTLDPKTKQIILDHVKSLDFDLKNVYEMQYDDCDKPSTGGKNEL